MTTLLKMVMPAIVAKGGINSFAKFLYSQCFAVELSMYLGDIHIQLLLFPAS